MPNPKITITKPSKLYPFLEIYVKEQTRKSKKIYSVESTMILQLVTNWCHYTKPCPKTEKWLFDSVGKHNV
uniref:Uncharacterized protein n=1 Tax=Acrobeloides nanus TaxID=290746 RepID=A0A914BYZ5_9BILA